MDLAFSVVLNMRQNGNSPEAQMIHPVRQDARADVATAIVDRRLPLTAGRYHCRIWASQTPAADNLLRVAFWPTPLGRIPIRSAFRRPWRSRLHAEGECVCSE